MRPICIVTPVTTPERVYSNLDVAVLEMRIATSYRAARARARSIAAVRRYRFPILIMQSMSPAILTLRSAGYALCARCAPREFLIFVNREIHGGAFPGKIPRSLVERELKLRKRGERGGGADFQ